MTEHLLVARTDGVVTGTDGVMHRIHRGRTLAHPSHPAVQSSPQCFVPMEVQLPGPDGDDEIMAKVTEETAELRADLDAAVAVLVAIRDLLERRDLLPDESEMREDGWLVRHLSRVLGAESAPERPAPAVKPPRKATRPPARSGG
jgi:hypothetical protein